MQTWAKRGLQTALVTGGLLMLGTGIASAQENVSPDLPPSPIDGGQLVPTHFDQRTGDSQDLSRALRDQATDTASTGQTGGIPAPLRSSGRHAKATIPTVPQPSAPVDEPLTQPITDPVLGLLPGTDPVHVDPVPNELRNTVTENPLSLAPVNQPADLLTEPVHQLTQDADSTAVLPAATSAAVPQPAGDVTDVLPSLTNGLDPLLGGMDPASLTGRTVQVDWANPVTVANGLTGDVTGPATQDLTNNLVGSDTQPVGPLVKQTVGLLGNAPAGDLGTLPNDATNPEALPSDLLSAPADLPRHAGDLLANVTGQAPATGVVSGLTDPATTRPISSPAELPNAGVTELDSVVRDVVAEPENDLGQVSGATDGLVGSDPAGTLNTVTGQLGTVAPLSAPAGPSSVVHQVPTALLSSAMLGRVPSVDQATERATALGIPDSVDNLLGAAQLPDNTLLPQAFPSLRLPTSVPSSQAAPGTLPMLPTTAPDLSGHQLNTGTVRVGDVPGALRRGGLPSADTSALTRLLGVAGSAQTAGNLGRAAGMPTNLPALPATQDEPSHMVQGDLPLTGDLGPLGSAPVTANLPTDAVPFVGDFAVQQVQGTTYALPSANSVMDTAVLPLGESALDRALPIARDVPSGNVLPLAGQLTGMTAAQDAPAAPAAPGLPVVGNVVPGLPDASGLPVVGSLAGAVAPAAQDAPALPLVGDLGSATGGLPLVDGVIGMLSPAVPAVPADSTPTLPIVGSLTSATAPATQDAPTLPIVGNLVPGLPDTSGLPVVGSLTGATTPAPAAQDAPTLPIVGNLVPGLPDTSGLPVVGSLTGATAPAAQDAPTLPLVGNLVPDTAGLPLVSGLPAAAPAVPAVPGAAAPASDLAATQDLSALPVGGLPGANALPVVYQLPVGSIVRSVSVLPVSAPQARKHWDEPVGQPANTFDLPVSTGLPVDPVSTLTSSLADSPAGSLTSALPSTSSLPGLSDLPVASALPSTTLPSTNVGGVVPVLPSTQDAAAVPAVPSVPASSLTGAVNDLLTPSGINSVLRGATVDQLPLGAATQDAPADPLEYLPLAGNLPAAGPLVGQVTGAAPAVGQLTGLNTLYATPAQPNGVNALDLTGNALLYGADATIEGLAGQNVAQPTA